MTMIVRGKINARNEWTDQQTIWRAPNGLYTSSGTHYGTRLLFDRENHLFFGLGDRNFNQPNKAQDLTSPFGKIHRFNDDGTTPKDNPFVNTPGAVGSIWTYGHRNPEGLGLMATSTSLFRTRQAFRTSAFRHRHGVGSSDWCRRRRSARYLSTSSSSQM
jgi:glucose/arabinose dehydrogenase